MKHIKKFESFESINEEKKWWDLTGFAKSLVTAGLISLATLGFGQKVDQKENPYKKNLELAKLSVRFVDLQEEKPEMTLKDAIKKLGTNKEKFIEMLEMMKHLKVGDDGLKINDDLLQKLKDIEI